MHYIFPMSWLPSSCLDCADRNCKGRKYALKLLGTYSWHSKDKKLPIQSINTVMFNTVLKLWSLHLTAIHRIQNSGSFYSYPNPLPLASVSPHSWPSSTTLVGLAYSPLLVHSSSSFLNVGVPYDPGLCLLLFLLYNSPPCDLIQLFSSLHH